MEYTDPDVPDMLAFLDVSPCFMKVDSELFSDTVKNNVHSALKESKRG